ncbi:MAG: hypothetical protein INQ03_00825 [Candidatus Heimdallarchaeota archaeon]|nr:hypothetical protein [Candidatus Heimdallarchaeota archaeon]
MRNYSYPHTKKEDMVENINGFSIADPYRWLEENSGEEISNWIDQQNELSDGFIDDKLQEKLRNRLQELYNYPRYSIPIELNGKIFYTKNEGLQPQSVLYYKETLQGSEKLLFDPNTISDDGTIALTDAEFSKDARFCAMSIRSGGSDWAEVWIFDLEKNEFLDEKLENIRHAAVQWLDDCSGFYYSAYIGKEEVESSQKLWFHKLYDNQDKDEIIFESDDPHSSTYPQVFGDWLFLRIINSTLPQNKLYYRNIRSLGKLCKLVDEMDFGYQVIDVYDDTAIVYTNHNAKNGRIISIPLDYSIPSDWTEIIKESDPIAPYNGVAVLENHVIVKYYIDVVSKIKVFDLSGNFVKEIDLPGLGSIYMGECVSRSLFISYASFYNPPMIFRIDQLRLRKVFESSIPVDTEQLDSKQVFFHSIDDTKIPMFILHKKELTIDEHTPVLMYGYGGFNGSITPGYSSRAIL